MKMERGCPLPLGISEKEAYVNFAVVVEAGEDCTLCIFKRGKEQPDLEVVLPEDDAIGKVRFVALLKSNIAGKEYLYKIRGKYVVDPYAKSVVVSDAGVRGQISLDAYDWEDDKKLLLPQHEVIAYSLHVRGFTKHTSSKVKKKGTFSGIVEKIPYFMELGINQIQCMPVYAFEENSIYKNYWGYGPAYCFAVKDSYASGKDAGKELKDCVKACHKSGIEVVLNLPFTAEMSADTIRDCLRYYVLEYHIDGFILNPQNVPLDMLAEDPILSQTKLMINQDDFQNTMRRFLKGDGGMVEDVIGSMRQTTKRMQSCNYITNHTGFTLMDLVSYAEKHNEANGEENTDGPKENYSWNCGEEGPSRKKAVQELRERQRRNAMSLLLTAQGTPVILAGDEFGNSQGGNNNVYCQDNETSWLNWKNLEKDESFFSFVKQLIRMRKEFAFLHPEKELLGADPSGCGKPDISYHGEEAWKASTEWESRQLGAYYHAAGDMDCYIAYNMHWMEKEFALPSLGKQKEWHCVLTTAEMPQIINDKAVLAGRTAAVFVGKE